jgi:diguanylate cyclase (GGDEF)-like protein
MFTRLSSLPSLNSLMLRPKFILAFAFMAVLAAACGSIGLFFVDRIGRTVSVFTDTTSPLLTESMALVENAQRMRTHFFRALSSGEGIEQIPRDLAGFETQGHDRLQRLRALAAKARVEIDLDAVEAYQSSFVQVLSGMLDAHRRQQAVSLAMKENVAQFEARQRELKSILIDLIGRTDGTITKTEDEAKVAVQTGSATVDSLGDLLSHLLTEIYPVLQNATRLTRDTEQIGETAKLLLAQTDPATLLAIETQLRGAFKVANAVIRRLAGRLRDPAGRTELAQIQRAMTDLQAALLSNDGLLASQRATLAAGSELAAGREALEHTNRLYMNVLHSVRDAVSGLNQKARQNAADDIADGRTIVGLGALLAFLASVAFGLFFAQRITGPVVRLTSHAAAIRERGELRTLRDDSLTRRGDEIGMLARSFNLMIEQLADARQRLIRWSEAEISKQYERLNAAINNMPQGLCMFDKEQHLIICNQRYAEIYEIPPEYTIPGTPLRTILQNRVKRGVTPKDDTDYVANRLTAVSAGQPLYLVNEMADGHVIAITHQPMRDGGAIATHEDITERRKAEAQIAYMAHHDALTGLPNRVQFREKMNAAIERIARGETLAVHCLDLDYFKAVNDTLGHPVGDALLQEVSARIRECVRPSDAVARLGGDEFAILQVALEQPADTTILAARLIKQISQPFDIQGHQVVIGTSIGIALAPADGSDPDVLMKNADMALYRAKEDGRGTYRFFEPGMDARMQARRVLELDLRKALARDEFDVFYQPLIRLQGQQIIGFEALLRWRHPERGLVLPEQFVPLAEDIGLIVPIGAWVLRQACREAANWPSSIKVAVNLSPVQFKNGAVVCDVKSALEASGLDPHRLELEITEAILLQNTETTISTLNELRQLGVRIAMDDFGTGYSSLGYLRKFPFDRIKIDRSFIGDLGKKHDSVAIVRAVTGLASTLGIPTTAEGVETIEQYRQIEEEGCTEVQGYLFSEPKAADELGPLLKQYGLPSKAVA